MKFLLRGIAICAMINYSPFLYGQFMSSPVFNLCFEEEISEKVLIAENFEIEHLSIPERLLLENKEIIIKHHEYMNSLDNATHDITIIEQENFFPDWVHL